jgi:mannose-6-phosphate isomerase-like protein (cupin superfamily)
MGTDGVVLQPGKGRILSGLGSVITFKAVSEATGGRYSLVEYYAAPNFQGPPPHIHPDVEEAFYILEGEFAIRLGVDTIRAPVGTFVLIPRGTIHTFSNPGDQPARFLVIVSPGGFERYFEELAPLVGEHGYPPPEVMKALGEKYNFLVIDAPPC